MRLERVEITGFGRLGALRLDLHPELTVVLGENEAGKSTLQRAIRAALYGLDAGGQGRAAVRSDWARWRPWQGERYGVCVTYSLDDGRRLRVARRFEQRDERVQVQELGGRELTDSLRSGRVVSPGTVHLGVDEAVFCATACLGEDGLRLDAPDTATARAGDLQEAIERLADAAGRATAAEALARLRQAMERVGTERSRKSQLGAATARLREVEAALDRASSRHLALAGEQERLHVLDAAAGVAASRRLAAERDWIAARLCSIAAHRSELRQARHDSQRLEHAVGEWGPLEHFPLQLEERVLGLGVELRLAIEAETVAGRRWEAASTQIATIDHRRVEIVVAVRALGGAPRVTPADLEEATELRCELAAESGLERRAQTIRGAEARISGLRREIAGMGLGSVPIGSAATVGDLIGEAAEGGRIAALRSLAAGVAMLGMLVGAAGVWVGLRVLAIVAALVGLAVGGLLLAAERLGGGPPAAARRQLARLCPGLDLSASGLERAAAGIGPLGDLHNDLARQQAIADTGRSELEDAAERTADLAQRSRALAARLPVPVPAEVPYRGAVGAAVDLLQTRAALDAIEAAAGAGRRRAELEDEDAGLGARAAQLRVTQDDAAAATARRLELAAELAAHMETAGLAAEPDPSASVAAFRGAAAARRQLDGARAALGEVRRRIAALGPADDPALAEQAGQLALELRRRGGDPDAVPAELPFDAGRLNSLEIDAERSRQEEENARSAAATLRSRLAGALDGLASVADLQDEREACLAVRERCLRQLEALRCAQTHIEEAARRVHRDVAPRLAAAVGSRLGLLTEGRYSEVSIDAERFAVSLHSPERLELVPLELVSRGTREQVALLLRLALVEVLGQAGETVPLLLDDPLLSSDPLRRASAAGFLRGLSQTTQVVVFASDPALIEELSAGGDCAVVRLGRRDDIVVAVEGVAERSLRAERSISRVAS